MAKRKKKKTARKRTAPANIPQRNAADAPAFADGGKKSTGLTVALLLLMTAAIALILAVLEHLKETALNG